MAKKTCPTCGGTGVTLTGDQTYPCTTCGGSGYVEDYSKKNNKGE